MASRQRLLLVAPSFSFAAFDDAIVNFWLRGLTMTWDARRVGGKQAVGGALYVAATLQYLVAQVVSAKAWNPPYDWLNNYISDLGNTSCGEFTLPHGAPAFVCSPLHALMNASFVLSGALIGTATILIWKFWPVGRLATIAGVLWLLAAAGKVGVGLVPENMNPALHTAAALNIPIGGLAILLLSLAQSHERKALALLGYAIFSLTLVASALSIAAQFAGSGLLLGLGVGGMERLAGYPANVWLTVVGLVVVSEGARFAYATKAVLRPRSSFQQAD
jgi:hypothetical membrane protein